MADGAIRRLLNGAWRVREASRIFRDPPHVPRGHYYSPLLGKDERERYARYLRVRPIPADVPAVDLRLPEQIDLAQRLSAHYRHLPWTDEPGMDRGLRYHYWNTWYHYADAVTYACMLMEYRPRRVIEVGSGFSSALLLDVNDRFLGSATRITFIEPFPDRLLELTTKTDLEGRLVEKSLQQVPLNSFRQLESGDVLFVDSTHVCRPQSDVNYLFFEVLPVLKPGVLVHLHDIFYPFEYPADWIERGWSWTENYLLRAFLQYNGSFRIEFMNTLVQRVHADWYRNNMALALREGPGPAGSIWLRRV